ncbi:MAG: electron transfer flavoprotein subunit beta/FixA family protein [Deltaproteobacteria bacterium]|nr:electron transfer flavoprotein subunit beta/FixA family protein [Deltaproteobacteria bacterium]
MKIAVLIKQVPDTETKIRIKADGSGIETDGIKYIISPYDEFAVEEAIRTKEKNAGSEVTVISLGPDRCVESIRTALAMGCDKAVHVQDGGQDFDSFQTATLLSQIIKNQGFEVVFTGKQALDKDSGQVTQMIAELLNWPQVTVVEKIEWQGNVAKVTRRVAGGAKEVYEVQLPALLAAETGLNTPRYASLPGIMKAKSKPVEKLNAADLLAGATAKVTLSNYRLPPEKAPGRILQGELDKTIPELVKLLREEAKII